MDQRLKSPCNQGDTILSRIGFAPCVKSADNRTRFCPMNRCFHAPKTVNSFDNRTTF